MYTENWEHGGCITFHDYARFLWKSCFDDVSPSVATPHARLTGTRSVREVPQFLGGVCYCWAVADSHSSTSARGATRLSAISQQDTASSTKAYTRQLTCHTSRCTWSRHCSFTPINRFDLLVFCYTLWVARYSSRVVSVLDSGAEGPGLKSQRNNNNNRKLNYKHWIG